MTEDILVCMPVSLLPHTPVKAWKRRCDICSCAIWVARSSPPANKRWCTPCAELELGPNPEWEPPTAAQTADIDNYNKSKLS